MKRLTSGGKSDTGASAVEYGLIVFAIAAILTVAVVSFGGVVTSLFQDSCDKVSVKTTSHTC
jgi:pilus assembly protein Flp/PilA